MSFKTVEEKIMFLNKLVGGTLGVVHYTDWELNSYASSSLFACEGIIGHVCMPSFTGCIDKAFHLIKEAIGNG